MIGSSHVKASNTSVKSPLVELWQPSAILSIICIGELVAAVFALLPGLQFDRWIYFGLASLAIQWIALLSIATIYLLRVTLQKLPVTNTAWWCLAIFVTNTFLFSLLLWKGLNLGLGQINQTPLGFALNMALLAFLVGLLGLAAFQNHWRNIQLAIKNKQAQLDALQSRIQPHFLFNALNSLAALIHTQPAKAETLLLNLSDLFRATLSGNTEVSLATELENTKHYLDIEKMRYGDRMLVEWQLPEQLPDIVLPALCLQPLAENAVKHGIDPSIKGGSICISIQNQSNQVLIRISNTLPDGLQLPTNEGFNIGLRTTIERIALMSDGGNQLKTYLRNGQFVAEITVRNTV